ncbi:hypothetical protein SAMN04488535_1531 [Corynebacterium mycetoides]|uniref:Uncharacterized protein n=1 Tax=Corynebacterium mycetoides TaxID=38302 RepID=A0A1G9PQI1_9CORY|nr:hypothetical protein [Corynebacterium mycetoides]SDM00325.1 hypothetical protein SAMN04488535_1531 [Corynebacterium mycetoides]
MSVRRINASEPCARTVASLDDNITVADTGNSTVLYNLPRDIDAIDDVVGTPRRGGFGRRLRQLFGRGA